MSPNIILHSVVIFIVTVIVAVYTIQLQYFIVDVIVKIVLYVFFNWELQYPLYFFFFFFLIHCINFRK